MGDEAKDYIPQIAELLKDPDWGIRFAAAQALENMGEVAIEQVPKIVDLLKDGERICRELL